MAHRSLLIIVPDARLQPDYMRVFSSDGYAVHAVCSLDEACKQLLQRTYDAIVFDIDEEIPGEVMNSISSIQPRRGAPLIVQGSAESLAQMLAEFSQPKAEKAAKLEADALVFKCPDVTELRITLKDLIQQKRGA